MNLSARAVENDLALEGSHDVTVKVFDAATAGTELFSEDHQGVAVAKGLFFISIGSVTPLDATVFDGSDSFLEISIDGTVMSPRLTIGSVPYAQRATAAFEADHAVESDHTLEADNAGSIGGITPDNIVTAVNPGAGFVSGGSTTGALTLDIDYSAVQARVNGACGPDSAVLSVNGDGTVNCSALLQERVLGSCVAGQSIRAIDAFGNVTCEVDDGATYTAGSGLTLTGSAFAVSFGTIGVATTAMRSDGAIQAQTAVAQAANFRTNGTMRIGNETGTGLGPSYPGTSTGMVYRRSMSTAITAGSIIARTDNMILERDGTNGGIRINNVLGSTNNSIVCQGVTTAGTTLTYQSGGAALSTVAVFLNTDNVISFYCRFGYTYLTSGNFTEVQMQRATGDYYWMGSLSSTYNQ